MQVHAPAGAPGSRQLSTNKGMGACSVEAAACCDSSACRCAYSSGNARSRMSLSVRVTGIPRPTCSRVLHRGHLHPHHTCSALSGRGAHAGCPALHGQAARSARRVAQQGSREPTWRSGLTRAGSRAGRRCARRGWLQARTAASGTGYSPCPQSAPVCTTALILQSAAALHLRGGEREAALNLMYEAIEVRSRHKRHCCWQSRNANRDNLRGNRSPILHRCDSIPAIKTFPKACYDFKQIICSAPLLSTCTC